MKFDSVSQRWLRLLFDELERLGRHPLIGHADLLNPKVRQQVCARAERAGQEHGDAVEQDLIVRQRFESPGERPGAVLAGGREMAALHVRRRAEWGRSLGLCEVVPEVVDELADDW